jgi:hypothetical protein
MLKDQPLNRTNNYKHPDWYGNDYEVGRHLMGLIMKVDRATTKRPSGSATSPSL